MKNCIYLLLFVCLFLITACDTNGEGVYSGHISFTVSFVYPTDAYDNYEVVFNGNEVSKTGGVAADRDDPTGTLEVYKKGSDTPELSKEITVSSGEVIQLIKLAGQSIDIYDENTYDSFTLNLVFQKDKESQYKVYFNDVQINNGLDYIKKEDKHTGVLKIYKEGVEVAVFSQDVTIVANGLINVMQLSDTEFLLIPEDSEPAPESNQYTKLRFFYTSDALPGVERIKVIIYEWTNFTELGSVEMEVGQLSAYQTIDWNVVGNGGLCQDVIDLTNGEPGVKIVDSAINMDAYISVSRGIYKFATTRLGTDGGVLITPVAALCTPW